MNEFEERARALKAWTIANVCTDAGIENIATLDDNRKTLVLMGAGATSASDKTWALAQQYLNDRWQLAQESEEELFRRL